MTQHENLAPPGEPEPTFAYPIHSILHLAELLTELDEFLRSGIGVTICSPSS